MRPNLIPAARKAATMLRHALDTIDACGSVNVAEARTALGDLMAELPPVHTHSVTLPTSEPDDRELREFVRSCGMSMTLVGGSYDPPFEEYEYRGTREDLVLLVFGFWSDPDLAQTIEEVVK